MAAIKILEHITGYRYLERVLKNEHFILEKLKEEKKTAVDLGYVQLYDYIDEGHLVAKVTR